MLNNNNNNTQDNGNMYIEKVRRKRQCFVLLDVMVLSRCQQVVSLSFFVFETMIMIVLMVIKSFS
jgi:hypothetical protein